MNYRREYSVSGPIAETGFHPESVSTEVRFAASLSNILVHRRKVCLLEVRVFIQYVVFGHACAEPPQNIQTVIRSPRMQGFPPRLPGSTVILVLTIDILSGHSMTPSDVAGVPLVQARGVS